MERINVSSMEKAMGLKICQLCAVDFTLKHFLTPLIDGMRNKGWVVTSVCSDSGFVKELNKDGYKINVINISRNFNIYNHLKTFIKLVIFFRKEKFDILHVHTPIAGVAFHRSCEHTTHSLGEERMHAEPPHRRP